MSRQLIEVEDTMLASAGSQNMADIRCLGPHVKLAKHPLLSKECSNEQSVEINSRVRVESSRPLCFPTDLELVALKF